MRKALVAGAVLALAFTGALLAQQVSQQQISGQECWQAAQGPGGQGQWLCIPLVRNGSDIQTVSGTGAVTTQAPQGTGTLYWTGAAPTTWAVTLPNVPFDGQLVRLSTDTTLTTMVTVTAGSSGTMNAAYAAQTLTLNTSVVWQFDQPANKWYRLQ
jgi:hypothetical protein